MSGQDDKAGRFKALHVPGDPLVLVNVWDAGSARVVAEAGAAAVATGSWSVAAAHGFPDGEALPLELVLANAARIAAAVVLPVSLDVESGYGAGPEEVRATFERVTATGVVGCNLEDSFPADGALRPVSEQVARLAAARAGTHAQPGFFINARTDVFFQGGAETHDAALVDQALERAKAYADAGADGVFVPGLAAPALIARLCEASPLPVNVMVGANSPPRAELAGLGVARISHGPGPWRRAMAALGQAAADALA